MRVSLSRHFSRFCSLRSCCGRIGEYANREDLERNLPQSNKAENADMRGAYAVSGRGGIAHEPAVDKPRRRGGKQMKTYGEEDL